MNEICNNIINKRNIAHLKNFICKDATKIRGDNMNLKGWPFEPLDVFEPDGPPADPGSGNGTPL